MSAGKSAAFRHQLEPLFAGVLEVVGLLQSVDRADVDAFAAHDAAALVHFERAQRALVERQSGRGAGADAATATDAVGQLEGFAVGGVHVDSEAAAGEVVAGRAGHVPADPYTAAACDAALHVAADEGVLRLWLDCADAAALLDQLVGGDAVLHAQPLKIALAEAGADALQAALRLFLGGRERVALVDLDVETTQPLRLGSLGHSGASLRLGAGPHREPHRVALGQPLRDRAERLSPRELLEIG